MADVFISYKSEEYEDALWVRRYLEEHGISCWMAPENIPGGSSYAQQIPSAIRGCSAFVLILSSRAQASRWVRRELDMALNADKPVFPFVLEQFELTGDMTFYLSIVQCYFAYKGRGSAMSQMLWQILDVLEQHGHRKHTPAVDPQEALRRRALENDPEAKERFQTLLPQAQDGDIEAQYQLGLLYETGEGVPQDSQEAMQWYKKAAPRKHAEAQYRLGMCYLYGKHKSDGVKWLQKAAQQKHADALYSLGMCYLDGTGVTESLTNALACLSRAGEQEHWRAQFRMAQLYESRYNEAPHSGVDLGLARKQYLRQAIYWYEKAAKRDDPEAMFRLGRLWEKKKPDLAMDYYCRAAEYDHTLAQYTLVQLYFARNALEKAIDLLRNAAGQEMPDAQYQLACCYRAGKGVRAAQSPADYWMERAAEGGHGDAQYQTALRLKLQSGRGHGKNRAQDQKNALRFLDCAAKKGHADAICALALCHYFGTCVAKDERRAKALLKQNQDHMLSALYLADLLMREDPRKAEQLLTDAAGRHYVPAMASLARLKERQGLMEEAIYWYAMGAVAGDMWAKERFRELSQTYRQRWQEAHNLRRKLRNAHSTAFVPYDTSFDIWTRA